MEFHHPFACITFNNGRAKSLKITKVTFEDINNNGTFTYNSATQWTPSGDDVDFEGTYSADYADTEVITLGGPYLVVPQNKSVTIKVATKALDWGGTPEKEKEYSATISINWQPGYSYVYTFNIVNGDLVVNTKTFTEQW